jgi:hypothetical protein
MQVQCSAVAVQHHSLAQTRLGDFSCGSCRSGACACGESLRRRRGTVSYGDAFFGSHSESRSHGAVRPRVGSLVQLGSCLCTACGPGGARQRWQRISSHLGRNAAGECSRHRSTCVCKLATAIESRHDSDEHAGVVCHPQATEHRQLSSAFIQLAYMLPQSISKCSWPYLPSYHWEG